MNETTGVDWLPALLVLGIGLVVGVAAALIVSARSRKARKRTEKVPVQVRDLTSKRDALMGQLRELDDTAGKRTAEQLAHERYALELEAAHVLLALDERMPKERPMRATKSAAEGGANATARPTSERAGLRGFFWGVGSATAILLIGLFVYQSAKPRETGGSVTGEPGGMNRNSPAPASAEEAQLKAAVASNPDNVEAHLGLAHAYLERQDWMGVWKETSEVLKRQPGNPPALAYQGLVRLAMGQNAVAVDLLSKALAKDPDLVDGYSYLALGYIRLGRTRDAEATMTRASKRFPDRAAEFRRLLGEMEKQEPTVAQAGPPGDAPDPHAGLATPGESSAGRATTAGRATAARGATPAQGGGRRVSGTIDIDPGAKSKIEARSILFVFAREAGATEGPPIAAKRLPPRFPVEFELSEADSMLGQPFPDSLLIEARLDSDGDPTTRPPTDPKARADKVKAGRNDVRLVLR
ncbi:MAG TPA: tetratricopeptide repeat protein [Myxococcales bacterium]|nr:tetratricopeptide repeat protein [Myxococcales bacterium]